MRKQFLKMVNYFFHIYTKESYHMSQALQYEEPLIIIITIIHVLIKRTYSYINTRSGWFQFVLWCWWKRLFWSTRWWSVV